jgi:hypothetical protein
VGGLLCVVCFYLCMGVGLCVVHVCVCDCVLLCVVASLSVCGLLCVGVREREIVCYDHMCEIVIAEKDMWGGVGCLVI